MGFWKKLSSRTKVSTQEGSVNQGSPSTAPAPTSHPQGLEIVSEGSNPIIDIVVIHGLNGHREKTWTAKNGVHWLRDLLRIDIPEARILSWGYDAKTHAASSSDTSCAFLYDHARTLVSDLNRRRMLTKTSERPIIFIAHSLGGIVVKSALIHSDSARKGALLDQRSIKLSTYGIVFMGTPHQGGNGVQLGRILINAASVFVQADDRLLKHLERDSEWLLQQPGQYGPISGEFVTKFAYEEYETPIAMGKKILVVPRASAVVPGQADAEPIAIHANHKNMVKFKSKEDVGYITILENLQIMMKDAEAVIRARWEAERRADNARADGKDFSLEFSLSEVNDVNHFVARNEELAQLKKILTNSHDRRTVAIHALGGMGKTQLAITFAKQNRNDFSAVFWMNATDKETLKQSFLRAADRILRQRSPLSYVEDAVASNDPDMIVKAVGRWLSERSNNQWLIIFDNYDHPTLGDSVGSRHSQHDDSIVTKDYDIRPFFPETHHGAIIITTRSSLVKIGETVRLKKLECIEDGLKILESTSRRERLMQDPAAVRLAEKLDGLPLALATAGAYLDQVAMSCAEYLQLYQESWGRLQESSPQLLSYEDRAMFSTWNISYENVEKLNQSSAMLLKLWAYFDHEDLWYELLSDAKKRTPPWLQVLTDKLTFVKSMRLLCDHGLVEANTVFGENETGSPGYSVHGCVHAWMIDVLHKKTDRDMVRIAATCVASLIPSKKDKEYWLIQRRLLRHADRCLEMMTESTEMPDFAPWIYREFGSLFRHQDRLKKAQTMYERSLQGNEKTLGPMHTLTLGTVHDLGLTYEKLGEFKEAEAMHKRALQGYEEALDPKKVSNTMNSLALLYFKQDRFAEAEVMYEQTLKRYETSLGPEHASTLRVVDNLANLYCGQGRLDEAERLYKRALQGKEKTLGPNHTSTIKTVNNLGSVYFEQDRLDEAEILCQQALQGQEKVLGPDNTSTLRAVSNLGSIYLEQGRLDEAERMCKRVLEGKEKALGPEHTSTLKAVHKLGRIYFRQGRPNEAEILYQRALQGQEKSLGPNHTSTINAALNLGVFYDHRGRFEEAETMYMRVLEGYEKVFGSIAFKTHLTSLRILENLADIYQHVNKPELAEKCYLQAHSGLEMALGENHERTIKVKRKLEDLGLCD
ncbi:hypothetical protein FSHL1_002949 [Fusarium sambucinum]